MPARPSLERFSLDLKGVEFRPLGRVHELIASSGAVTRVRYRTMAMGTAEQRQHLRLSFAAG
jgi:hypothetical protein